MAYLIMCKKTKQCVAVYQNKETLKGLDTDKFDFIDDAEIEKAKAERKEREIKKQQERFKQNTTTSANNLATSGLNGGSCFSYSPNGSSSSCDSSSSSSSDSGSCV